MKQAWQIILKCIRIALGCVLLILGVIGLFTPLLQGVLFIAIGLLILAKDVPFFHRLLVRIETRFPVVKRVLDTGRGWVHRSRNKAASPVGEGEEPRPE